MRGIAVREVADFTGFPEIMAGRVKTLHPKIHGGLLGRRGTDDAVMAREGILPIDLLVVNLYPFAATIAKPGVGYDEAIENIDVGGPAMLRGAAETMRMSPWWSIRPTIPALLAELERPTRRARASHSARGSRPRPSRTRRPTTRWWPITWRASTPIGRPLPR